MRHAFFAAIFMFLAFVTIPVHSAVVDQDVSNALVQNDKAGVIVQIRAGDDFGDVERGLGFREINVTNSFRTFNGFSAEISRGDLERLRRIPSVERIDYDEPVFIELQDSAPLVNATVLHSIQFNSSNVTGAGQAICIIDTGINYTHPDLGGCSNTSFLNGSCAKVPGGYDFVNDDSDPYDDHGHGTHVAGIAAANGSIKGVAPLASVVAVKALNSAGSGSLSDIAASIEWCTNNLTSQNITVISMSLGTTELNSTYCDLNPSYAALVSAINNATARGISVVAASGNDGSNTSISSPGCIQNSTAVGSTTKSDAISSFSNSNSIVDLLAPGSLINSTDFNGRYSVKSGTSMATPHVAGAVALLRHYKLLESGTNLTAVQAESALKNTGKNVTDSRNNVIIPRIDIHAALLSLDASSPVISVAAPTPANGTRTNATSVLVNITASERISSSTLEWDNGTKTNYTMNRTGSNGEAAFFNQSVANGTFTYRFYASDLAGNTASTAARTLTIDTSVPQISVASPANGSLLGNTNISLTYTVLDDSTDRCRYVNPSGTEVAIAGCGNITFTGLLGFQNITLIVNDTAGNVNSTQIFFNATSLLSVQRPENITYTGAVPINFSALNDFSSAWYRIDANSTNVTLSGNTTFTASDGGHNITIFANNSAGAIDSSAVFFTVDTTAPSVILNAPSNTTVNTTNSVTFNATMNEAISSATLELDGSNESMTRTGLSWAKAKILADGTHSFKVYANDSVNNTGSSSARSFTVMTVRNESSFFSRLNETNTANNATVRIIFNSTDADVSNISILQNYTLEFNISGIIVKVANFSASEANFSSIVNVTRNVTTTNLTLNFSALGGSLNRTVWIDMNNFVMNFTPVVSFERAFRIFFQLNGTRESPDFSRINNTCDANITNKPCFSTSTNSSSVHLLSFSGVSAGDDTQAPAINITAPAAGATFTSSSVTANFTVSDNVAVDSCWYKLNSAANVSLSSCANFTVTAASGSNTLRIYSNDSSGNSNESSVTFTFSTPSSSSPSSSTSSGGGGGSSSTTAITADKAVFSIDFIRPEKPADFKVKSPALAIKRLLIHVNAVQRDSAITMTGRNRTPVTPLSDNTYQYIEITKSRLDERQITRADFEFEINNSWLEQKDLDEGSVWLFRFNEITQLWDGYRADTISSNATVARYNVSLPALSWLGITAMQKERQAPQNKTEEVCVQVITPAVMNETCTEYPTPCDVPEGWTIVQSCEPAPVEVITAPSAPAGAINENAVILGIILAAVFAAFALAKSHRRGFK